MDNFIEIDLKFIDLLYFKNEIQKNEFIQAIENKLNSHFINKETERIELLEKFKNEKLEWKIIADLLVFHYDKLTGIKRINNYYTALNLCNYNFNLKLENKENDYSFEENLLNKSLEKNIFNFMMLETLYNFGKGFHKLKIFNKRDYYFSIICNNKFDLSQKTVSEFYKKIGIIYMDSKQEVSKKWFESGLKMNNKLGVKRILSSIK